MFCVAGGRLFPQHDDHSSRLDRVERGGNLRERCPLSSPVQSGRLRLPVRGVRDPVGSQPVAVRSTRARRAAVVRSTGRAADGEKQRGHLPLSSAGRDKVSTRLSTS